MTTEEHWVGVEDVAIHLGVAKDSVYRWIDERGLPAHRVGRLFRFKLSEIDEWVRQDNKQERSSNSISAPPPSASVVNQYEIKSRSTKRCKNE